MLDKVLLSTISIEDLKAEISSVVKQEIQRSLTSPVQNTATEFLTRKETAKMLGVSLPTILEWTKRGKVKGYRIGSRIRYKKAEIESSLTLIKTKLHDKED